MILEHSAKSLGFCNVYIHTITQCFSPGIFFFLVGSTPAGSHHADILLILHYVLLKILQVSASKLSEEILFELLFYQRLFRVIGAGTDVARKKADDSKGSKKQKVIDSNNKPKGLLNWVVIENWSFMFHVLMVCICVYLDLFLSFQILNLEFGSRGMMFIMIGYLSVSPVERNRKDFLPVWQFGCVGIHICRVYLNVMIAESWTKTTMGIVWSLVMLSVSCVLICSTSYYHYTPINLSRRWGTRFFQLVQWCAVWPAKNSLYMYSLHMIVIHVIYQTLNYLGKT